MLKVNLDVEGDRWTGKYPSIIDPACGDGVFLKVALEKCITEPKRVWGVDIDEKVKENWVEINLLKSFGSRAELEHHFFHQNGLLPLPEKILRYKQGGLKEFDLVVGNPPYGGVGIDFAKLKLDESKEILNAFRTYDLINYRKSKNIQNDNQSDQGALFANDLVDNQSKELHSANTPLIESIPIEAYFIERFIQLAKPGGHIAIIIPDGILANSNLHYVRQYIAENVRVNAIVSLPRDTFKNVGTSAKTSIIFMSKTKTSNADNNYPVFISSAQRLDCLTNICDIYKEAVKNGKILTNY
jgi:predicted RNA methylase